jgi:hypothetical protein
MSELVGIKQLRFSLFVMSQKISPSLHETILRLQSSLTPENINSNTYSHVLSIDFLFEAEEVRKLGLVPAEVVILFQSK